MIEEDFITMYIIRMKKIPAKHLQEHHQMQDKASWYVFPVQSNIN